MTEEQSGKLSIVIVGLGYVGVTAAACLASQGHKVVGVDINPEKVSTINAGRSPIAEPEVDVLIADAQAAGLLRASTYLPGMTDVDLVIVCVGTPSAADGSHNMGFVAESTRQIAAAVAAVDGGRVTVAFRSTFKPGTMDELITPIFDDVLGKNSERVELVYNPEFLRESTAVDDYFHPPKIVIGTAEGAHSDTMERLHHGIDAAVFETGFREAELTKFVDNSWHAVKVAFANEVGRVCAAYDIDAATAHKIFVADTKLNISPYYTRPGGAFGGSCLPKDVRAMQYIAQSAGTDLRLIGSLIDTNEAHKRFQLGRVLGAAQDGERILVVGLAFKSGTDDMRESPNVDLVASLVREGRDVRVYDPIVRMSSLVGQNLGHVLTVIPNLRDLLIDEAEVAAGGFGVVAINNASADHLDFPGASIVDLRVIAPTRTS